MSETKNSKIPRYAVIFTVAFKLLFLLTNYIQEDAFITWRVAQNLMDYGVIGFNGPVKISASTTHLYVFVSYLFNLIFGKENFIVPLLVFNSVLFTIGSLFLSHLLLKNAWDKAIFIF
uniref:Glycosyltransferase RgtA/B/C/D-like domain-containing protein n=2 Tax=Chryseobacterium TaxID=59732 RepID=A0AAU6WK72_9FLAO